MIWSHILFIAVIIILTIIARNCKIYSWKKWVSHGSVQNAFAKIKNQPQTWEEKKVHILGNIPARNRQNPVVLGVVLCLEIDIKLDDDN